MEIKSVASVSRFSRGFISLAFAVMLFSSVTAQQVEVADRANGESLPGAVITLTSMNDGTVRRAASGIEGSAAFETLAFAQKIEVRMLGYLPYRDTLAASCASVKCLLHFSADSLGAVVITAQYEETAPENAVQPIRIIDRAKIDAMGAQNLRDLLTNETNIRLSQDPVLGSSMNLQGISGENVKILIDGVPVIGRQNGNIDLSQISLANIERVEIIEGPQSVNYGTNALAGVINLVTAKRQAHSFSIGTDLFYESSGQYNTLLHAGLQHKRTVLLFTANRNYFDGWSDPHKPFRYEVPQIADSSRYMQWKPREQYAGTAQLIRHIDRGQFGLSTDWFNEKITNRGLPRAPYQENAFDDYYRTRRSSTVFHSRFRLNEKQRIELQAAYNYYRRTKNTFFKDLTTLDQQLVQDASLQDTSVFRLGMLRAVFVRSGDSLKLSYETGIHFEYETAEGVRIDNQIRSIGDYAVFASAEYRPWSWLTLRPGFRWSYNTAYASQPTPSLNALVSLNENWKLRIACSRGFRSPSLKELYFYFVDINHNIRGNESLLAEYSGNYMASLSWKKLQPKASYTISAGGFYNDIFNLITLALVQGTEYSYINIGRSRTAGFSGTAELRTKSIQLNLSGMYSARSAQLEGSDLLQEFLWSPELRFSLLWKEKRTGIITGAFVKYTGQLPQFMVDENDEVTRTVTGAYTTVDLSFGRRFMKDKLLAEIGCRNLLDVRTVPTGMSSGTHSDGTGSMLLANGRNYFFRLQYRFDFDKKEKL